MKITVLNGSPKGNQSVTMQYVKYIQNHFPEHEYVVHNISARIKKIEKDRTVFDKIISDVDASDSVIWATPVYTFFVPAQYMRFIELVYENGVAEAFRNKSATVISTSIHFYDHTAHRYMHAVCDDFGMKYNGFFSAEMDDLRKKKGRADLLQFAGNYFESSIKGHRVQKRYPPVRKHNFVFQPEEPAEKVNNAGKRIVVITDYREGDTGIQGMIRQFTDSFTEEIRVVNLWDLDIRGGCTGCIQCGYENNCIYNDSFSTFYREEIFSADIVVFAMVLSERNMSSRFKLFFDRRFFNNHAPELKHKQAGSILSGPIGQMPYLYDFCQGSFEWQHANLAGIVSDECGDSEEIRHSIQQLAETVVRYSSTTYCPPPTFLGVGGAKVFRDDIWGKLRFVFQADYKYYKKHKMFNFPQYNLKSRLFNAFIIPLTRIPRIRKEFYGRIKTEMYKPHAKIVNNIRQKQ